MMESLHNSDLIIVQDAPLSGYCVYSDTYIPEGDYRIRITDDAWSEVLKEPGCIITEISLTAVDSLCADLTGDFAPDDGLIDIGSNLHYVPPGEYDSVFSFCCPICDGKVYNYGFISASLHHMTTKDRAIVHEYCIDEFRESLQSVWEYSDELLKEIV